MKRIRFSMIVAFAKSSRGIGFRGTLPWKPIKEDMQWFKKVTVGKYSKTKRMNNVVMGSNTWRSLPAKYRPLPKRINTILTSKITATTDPHTRYCDWVHMTTPFVLGTDNFVIGGAQTYNEMIHHKHCDTLYITEIDDADDPYKCDTFFPKIPKHFQKIKEIQSPENAKIKFQVWKNCKASHKSQENQYLHLLSDICENGESRGDRTGTGTKSIFGKQLRFSLKNNTIPLLTTKRVWFKGVFEELLFFLRGDHDNRKLQRKGVHIWDGNTTREYLDQYEKPQINVNDLGVAYGVQWRAYGAKLGGIDANYIDQGDGIDQIQKCIEQIKEDPYSRRILFHGWNVKDLKNMALPPCHIMYQFLVSPEKQELSCMMTQRSADVFLGVPFNIASVALLTHLIAKVCGLKGGEIIINLGDAHIYNNHARQIETQLERKPLRFPKLKIRKEIKSLQDIEKLEYTDIELLNYDSYPSIKAKMAI